MLRRGPSQHDIGLESSAIRPYGPLRTLKGQLLGSRGATMYMTKAPDDSVTRYDPTQAYDGYTLFAPHGGTDA